MQLVSHLLFSQIRFDNCSVKRQCLTRFFLFSKGGQCHLSTTAQQHAAQFNHHKGIDQSLETIAAALVSVASKQNLLAYLSVTAERNFQFAGPRGRRKAAHPQVLAIGGDRAVVRWFVLLRLGVTLIARAKKSVKIPQQTVSRATKRRHRSVTIAHNHSSETNFWDLDTLRVHRHQVRQKETFTSV